MKAAEVAAAEFLHLQGAELHQQMRRVQELIATANQLQWETEPAARRDLALHDPPPGYNAAGKSKKGCEALSANRGRQTNKQPRAHREKSVSLHP